MITLTKAAAEKLGDLLHEQESTEASLRVFVRAGADGAPQVGMAIEPDPTDRDEIVETEGVRVVVDAESLPFVIGSEIDYMDSMLQAGFTIRNPNLMGGGGCACGGGGGACACGGGGGGASAEAGACACGQEHAH